MQEREVAGNLEHRQADQTDARLEGVSSPFQLLAERYIRVHMNPNPSVQLARMIGQSRSLS